MDKITKQDIAKFADHITIVGEKLDQLLDQMPETAEISLDFNGHWLYAVDEVRNDLQVWIDRLAVGEK